ncbi:hypothetical protein GCM10010428_04710 [Actinosynnema pretiosum subsp. pretiosum]
MEQPSATSLSRATADAGSTARAVTVRVGAPETPGSARVPTSGSGVNRSTQ